MGNNKKKTNPKKSRRTSQLQKIKEAIFQEPLRNPFLFVTTGIILLSILYFVTFELLQQEICFQVFKNKLLEPFFLNNT
jgi:hypothetical protein